MMTYREKRELFADRIYPATITPFTEDNKVNRRAMKQLMERNCREGARGLFIGGSSAECFLLSHEERIALFETAAEMKGKATLIAHVGAFATQEAIEYARAAKELGFDAVSATPPFYYGFNSAAINRYYYDIYEAVGLPIFIYNFPGNTGKEFDLADPCYRELFCSEAIIGVKHTNQVVYQLERIKNLNPELIMLNGYDETMIAALSLGADGAVGSTFNFMYPHFDKIWHAFKAGDLEQARTLQIKANNIMNVCVNVGLFPAIKYILGQQGIDAGLPRKPFLPLSEAQKKQVDAVLAENLEG
ncbi:MAG: N-acetylneuraminate lyase [Lachnospiraceae bacterium]|nr:N-acetylneuraminate lyase [Lachnospiraceae bacterium]